MLTNFTASHTLVRRRGQAPSRLGFSGSDVDKRPTNVRARLEVELLLPEPPYQKQEPNNWVAIRRQAYPRRCGVAPWHVSGGRLHHLMTTRCSTAGPCLVSQDTVPRALNACSVAASSPAALSWPESGAFGSDVSTAGLNSWSRVVLAGTSREFRTQGPAAARKKARSDHRALGDCLGAPDDEDFQRSRGVQVSTEGRLG